ncbi:DUF169 domain-containing protein [Helicovermis profundi]|uniref:DUF169 domain-containing protein n=1 Tax=Helicovermis profundi TaxID=3065157 RepID=A0AAU9E0R7_9FIRM|nr:DUF169 domain-containing protein [Clostridia bacterium S502]
MKENNVKKATIILNLKHHIIGVKLVDFKEDFDVLKISRTTKKNTICGHSRNAMDGMLFKAIREDVVCDYGSYALGLEKADKTILEGRSFQYCGLSENNTVGKDIAHSMKYVDMDVYGFVMGPLELMDDADVVIIADYAETIMRVMQGYAFKCGSAKNLSFYGNQAVCSDLISKPYNNNDINISLMCKGARAYGRFDKGELGISVPIGMFDALIDGLVQTITPVSNAKEKRRILEALDTPDELGVNIDITYTYGKGLIEYDEHVKNLRNK